MTQFYQQIFGKQQPNVGKTPQGKVGMLADVKPPPEPDGPHAEFARRLLAGMKKVEASQADVAEEIRGTTEFKSAMERVRLWMRGQRMPRDKELRRIAKMIGVDPADLRYGKKKPATLPLVEGEHVTDEDELALLRAYRGLKKEWARGALRARAVELLEEFGDKDATNPWATRKGTQ
jgi:hypothetical protein